MTILNQKHWNRLVIESHQNNDTIDDYESKIKKICIRTLEPKLLVLVCHESHCF